MAFPDFRSHVLRSANIRACIHALLPESPAQSEVSQLDIFAGVDEKITWLEVSVEHLLGVQVVECNHKLIEHLPHDLLGHIFVALAALLDQLRNVPVLTLLHDDVDLLLLLVDDAVLLADDVLVIQVAQDVHLVHQLLTLPLVHLVLTYFFPHVIFVVFETSYFFHTAERSFADFFDDFLVG